ncbi:MAG: Gfo/Idh/MocA family oxidoreductase [Pleurocapsa sp. SU_196_0]|nr:Gfo/Idh/MocA family oxidoreductase [Pleurocapsa sp. SU_196_0]
MNSRPLRVVLAGCGAMSAEWLRVAARIPALEIVGLVDVRLEAALERQRVFHLSSARVGTDLEAMLRDSRPDALFDVTVPEAHAENALLAFRYGVHVLGRNRWRTRWTRRDARWMRLETRL